MENKLEQKIAGILLFVAAAQFFLWMLIAVSTYPGYSVSGNYISDLGVGSTAIIFNTSIIVLGVMSLVAAVLLRKYSAAVLVTLVLAGIGAIGVGVFPETTGAYHTYSSLVVFLFGSIASYAVFAKERKGITAAFAVLGTIGLIALILYGMSIYMGLGKGGMERMIAYPDLLWILGYGAFLCAKGE